MDQTTEPNSIPATGRMRTAALAVHIFTAMGAGIALLAMLEAVREHWASMFGWLGVALIIDAIDGPLARRLDVVQVQPNWSGEVLDLVVDFVTYVFVPAYAITASGMLLPVAAPILGIGIMVSGRALFCRPAHEGVGQSLSRLPGAVERSGILFVLAAPAAGPVDYRNSHPDRADIRAVSCGASDPGGASALADPVADGHAEPCLRSIRSLRFQRGAPIVAGLCAIAIYVIGSDAVIRQIKSFRHDGITGKPGSLGGAVDVDRARNRARHRQCHFHFGDRLAYSSGAGQAGPPDRPVAGAGVPHHPSQRAGMADRSYRTGHCGARRRDCPGATSS